MTNQIKTTLQDAVERCRKEGGRYWPEDDSTIKYDKNWGGNISIKQALGVWIYEPPQQSAFQECLAGYKEATQTGTNIAYHMAKHLWNGALDAVCKEFSLYASAFDNVEKLKEP